jgi:2-hydroxychromene-2-carboxylate isomerase
MKPLELYYDFSSTNAYFAAFFAPELCQRIGAELIWKPYHLGTVFRARDHSVMRDHGDEKLVYLWDDNQRWSKKTGLAFNMPSTFPIKTALALRGSLVMRQVGKETDYIQAVMRAYWVDDLDISEATVLEKVGSDLGAEDFLTTANSETIRDQLKQTTAEGMARKAFGAPMFFVGDEMFWGKDRMDFVEAELLAS